jgi:hypothetical protein
MINAARETRAKLILMTPTWDIFPGQDGGPRNDALTEHAALIRDLAAAAAVGLADSYRAFEHCIQAGRGHLADLLSWPNHPNARGHALVAEELMRWFPFTLPDGAYGR